MSHQGNLYSTHFGSSMRGWSCIAYCMTMTDLHTCISQYSYNNQLHRKWNNQLGILCIFLLLDPHSIVPDMRSDRDQCLFGQSMAKGILKSIYPTQYEQSTWWGTRGTMLHIHTCIRKIQMCMTSTPGRPCMSRTRSCRFNIYGSSNCHRTHLGIS